MPNDVFTNSRSFARASSSHERSCEVTVDDGVLEIGFVKGPKCFSEISAIEITR